MGAQEGAAQFAAHHFKSIYYIYYIVYKLPIHQIVFKKNICYGVTCQTQRRKTTKKKEK